MRRKAATVTRISVFARHMAIATPLLACAAAGTCWGQSPAKAANAQGRADQNYPARAIRLIVPFPPGGAGGIIGHLIGPKLTEKWGQPVIVDNRGGAAGSIGSEIAARAVPDGHTLLLVTGSTIILNPIVSKVPFDPIKDFAPVIWTSSVPFVLLAHPSLAARSVKELVALAKAKPGTLNFGSGGNGSTGHLAGELFNVLSGAGLVHVAYKGGGPALIAILGAEVQLTFENLLPALPYIKTGQLRALAVTTSNRSPALPDIAAMREVGFAGYDVQQWNGVLAPAGTPREIILKLNREIDSIVKTPQIQEQLARQGAEVVGGSPDQLAAHMAAEIAKWRKVIKSAGLKFE